MKYWWQNRQQNSGNMKKIVQLKWHGTLSCGWQ